MGPSVDREVLVEKFRLREKQLAKIERQFHRLDKELAALEARLPDLEDRVPDSQEDTSTKLIRRSKPK